MNMVEVPERDSVGWDHRGIRVLLLTDEQDDRLEAQLLRLGAQVDIETEFFTAVDAILSDSTGFGLFVVNCDAFGGLAAGRKALSMIGARRPSTHVMLISEDCAAPTLPTDTEPMLLCAPVPDAVLRRGLEHVLRDRLVWRLRKSA